MYMRFMHLLFCIVSAATYCCAVSLSGLLFPAAGHAAQEQHSFVLAESSQLLDLSLSELMQVEVTSAGKKTQQLSHVPAAMTVVTRKDIERSTETTVPGLLRQVPGLHVARINSSAWMVSSRGFSDIYPNKLLVLVDGRPIYSSLFSGVLWPIHEMLLDNIERIEVIRGPAGVTWGANAFNGVINIITRNARETHGVYGATLHGKEETVAGFRWGGGNEHLSYRLWSRYADRGAQSLPDGDSAEDFVRTRLAGFRTDVEPTCDDSLLFTGEVITGDAKTPIDQYLLEPPYLLSTHQKQKGVSAYILGRWEHDFGADNILSLQLFYDRVNTELTIPANGRNLDMDTRQTKVDLELTHRFSPWDRHDLVWGVSVRMDDISLYTNHHDLRLYDPESRSSLLLAAFIQDEIELWRKALWLTLGAKLEHTDDMGLEVEPSAKILWEVNEGHSLWASASRAIRAPAQVERDAKHIINTVVPPQPGGPPFPIAIFASGSDEFDPETVLALEAGYRAKPWKETTLELSAYYNFYDDLRSVNPEDALPGDAPGVLLVPFTNGAKGETWGLEAELAVDLLPGWRLVGGYSFWEGEFSYPGSAGDQTDWANASPRHMFQLQSQLDLGEDLELDLYLRSIDNIKALSVPAYTELNMRAAWRPIDELELALIGRNLLNSAHQEFNAQRAPAIGFGTGLEIDRIVLGKITWRF